ncbi:MAG: hypothetical protein M1816_006229 [Peltula sp. TS41687]|nr:MAG: hypothetical protein M1816_006229 [Peltula sp. TS41687]
MAGSTIVNPEVLILLGLLGSFYLVRFLTRSDPLSKVPYYKVGSRPGKGVYSTVSSALEVAYPKFRDSFFKLYRNNEEILVIPTKFINELKSASEREVSFHEVTRQRLFGDRTLLSPPGPLDDNEVIKSIKVDLTRHLAKVVPEIENEISHALSEEIPASSEDWIEIFPAKTLLHVIALASGRVFASGGLNRNKDYLNASTMFAIDTFMAADKLHGYPKLLHPIAHWWIPELRRVWKHRAVMNRLIGPIMRERAQARQQGGEEAVDMLTWNVINSTSRKAVDVDHQAMNQLRVSAAAIHTTKMMLSHVLFDLAARPEYLEPLREEMIATMAIEPSGDLTRANMSRLRKLDSFMKESQRLNPLSQLGFDRKVMKDITLHDGTKLPRGIIIGTANGGIHRDPNYYTSPEQFDGFRFEKLRQEPGKENYYQFVSTGLDSLHFGHGMHACPGRFFAAMESKLILKHLILNYDMKLPDGQERPKNFETYTGIIPDWNKSILLKRRT